MPGRRNRKGCLPRTAEPERMPAEWGFCIGHEEKPRGKGRWFRAGTCGIIPVGRMSRENAFPLQLQQHGRAEHAVPAFRAQHPAVAGRDMAHRLQPQPGAAPLGGQEGSIGILPQFPLKGVVHCDQEALSLHLPPEYNLPPGSFLGHAGL